MDEIAQSSPPQLSMTYKSLSDNHTIKAKQEEQKNLFSYKKLFEYSESQLGIMKPAMGGAGYKDKILSGVSRAETGFINVEALSRKPLLNLLHISGMRTRGILTRYLYYGYVTTSKKTDHDYPSIKDMRNKVLCDEKVSHAIQTMMQTTRCDQSNPDRFLNDSQLEKRVRGKAVSIVDEMVASITSTALKFCGWLMLTLLRQLTSAIHIHQGQLEVLKLVLQEEKPVIYFPLHFSHFDYILLSLISYHNELRSPFVASGNNLMIQPFSYIMRRVGGFFIRRKIDDAINRDVLYRSVLHSYFTELLKRNQSLEIFIEGTRSRSGLPNLPKIGLLSVAVEALLKGEVEDINIVPICISYEKVLEGTFRNEIMGQAKRPETLLSSLFSICSMLCGFYGHIRVNIGVPQSMKKTLNQLMSSTACEFTSGLSIIQSSSSQLSTNLKMKSLVSADAASVRQSGQKMRANDSSPLMEHGNATDQNIRELVTFLGERIVYSSLTCKVFMSTNLVSFLLLHRWRHGVDLPQLVESFRQLTYELFSRKSDVGFSGNYNDVVLHAIDLLGSDLVTLECIYTLKRTNSNLSVRSRRSADSGYDGANVEASPSKVPLSGSDSGEDLSLLELEEPRTGNYMAETESGNSFGCSSSTRNDLFPNSSFLKPTVPINHQVVTLHISPVLGLPQVFDLAYYANALTPVFALESLVALSVGAVLECRLSLIAQKLRYLTVDSTAESIEMPADDLPEAAFRSFTRARLIEKTLQLIDLLQMDLILCDVTTNLEFAVNEAVDKLTSSGYLIAQDYGNSAATRKSQAAKELGFDENECENDSWIKVDVEQIPSFVTTQSVMSSFVEGYVAAATQLPILLEQPLPVEELKNKMLHTAQERVTQGLAVRSESSSSDIIRNALRSFQWNEIVVRNSNKEYCLGSNYQDIDSLCNLVSRISQFLS